MHAHLFINFCLNKPCHTQYNQYPSELIINSSHHRQFLRWGAFHSAKTDSRLLRNLIFIPFTKVASTHSSIKYFQISWCHMIDETFSQTYLWKFSKKVSQFLIGRLSKVSTFYWDTRYRPLQTNAILSVFRFTYLSMYGQTSYNFNSVFVRYELSQH